VQPTTFTQKHGLTAVNIDYLERVNGLRLQLSKYGYRVDVLSNPRFTLETGTQRILNKYRIDRISDWLYFFYYRELAKINHIKIQSDNTEEPYPRIFDRSKPFFANEEDWSKLRLIASQTSEAPLPYLGRTLVNANCKEIENLKHISEPIEPNTDKTAPAEEIEDLLRELLSSKSVPKERLNEWFGQFYRDELLPPKSLKSNEFANIELKNGVWGKLEAMSIELYDTKYSETTRLIRNILGCLAYNTPDTPDEDFQNVKAQKKQHALFTARINETLEPILEWCYAFIKMPNAYKNQEKIEKVFATERARLMCVKYTMTTKLRSNNDCVKNIAETVKQSQVMLRKRIGNTKTNGIDNNDLTSLIEGFDDIDDDNLTSFETETDGSGSAELDAYSDDISTEYTEDSETDTEYFNNDTDYFNEFYNKILEITAFPENDISIMKNFVDTLSIDEAKSLRKQCEGTFLYDKLAESLKTVNFKKQDVFKTPDISTKIKTLDPQIYEAFRTPILDFFDTKKGLLQLRFMKIIGQEWPRQITLQKSIFRVTGDANNLQSTTQSTGTIEVPCQNDESDLISELIKLDADHDDATRVSKLAFKTLPMINVSEVIFRIKTLMAVSDVVPKLSAIEALVFLCGTANETDKDVYQLVTDLICEGVNSELAKAFGKELLSGLYNFQDLDMDILSMLQTIHDNPPTPILIDDTIQTPKQSTVSLSKNKIIACGLKNLDPETILNQATAAYMKLRIKAGIKTYRDKDNEIFCS